MNRGLLASMRLVGAVIAVTACNHQRPSGADSDGGATPKQPALDVDAGTDSGSFVTAEHAPCALNADCSAGEHCDLAECVHSCGADAPCTADKVCSPRGSCLTPSAKDEEAPLVVTRAGAVHADPSAVSLTDRDADLRVHLVTDAKDAVRYRVVLDAPYLSIDEPRGQFEGETVIHVAVDRSKLAGRSASGSIRVITSLGEIAVTAPIAVGLTGRYQGSLTYEGHAGGTLGTTHLAIDMVEKNGDVRLRVDPARSLLFRTSSTGQPVVGRGSFTDTEGAELSVTQILPADFAGKDDLFHRALGREIRLHLEPGDRGSLDGTFDENIHGLFQAPVALGGHAHFERVACEDPSNCDSPMVTGDPPAMPVADPTAAPDIATVFPGWSAAECSLGAALHLAQPCNGSVLDCSTAIDQAFHQPFLDRLSGAPSSTTDPLGDLGAACAAELARTDATQKVTCAEIPPLACALVSTDPAVTGTSSDDLFATLFAHTLDPAVFVAQDDAVKALKDSFIHGLQGESDLLKGGFGVLAPPMTWVLHPRLLEALRRLPATATSGQAEPPSFGAARTLARAFSALSTIQAELARIEAGSRTHSADEERVDAQNHGLLALFEAATLAGVAEAWPAVPNELGTQFVDVLTPVDDGFSSLVQGARVFGVAEGLIPNVYEPGREPTNFEQLLDMAKSRVESELRDETTFTSANRQFEDDEGQLETELEQVSTGAEDQIKAACGDGFALDAPDWTTCGADGSGTVASKLLAIQQANERLREGQTAIKGKYDHIQIEAARVADVEQIRESTIAFTAETGEHLQALTVAEGVINAEEKFLEVASQANVWNGGAPLGEAIGMSLLEGVKTELESDRQAVQTAQDLRVQEDDSRVEVTNGMAAIKGLLVDMEQLKVEMREDVIGVMQARLDAENALADARRASAARSRSLSRIGSSSLHDPTFRLVEDRAALNAMASRAEAQQGLYEAGRGLEYYLNRSIGDALGSAVLNAFDYNEAKGLSDCFQSIFDGSRLSLPKTEAYTTDVSVRTLLGITGPRTDEVTGERLTAGDQFRLALLKNENLDGLGGAGIEFASTLDPGNGLWSSDVCDDRVTQVEAELVGDFLGDNQAEVYLDLEGGGVLRRCDADEPMTWATSGHAVLQAGVNGFGTAPPNDSLNDLPVASSKWRVIIPGPSAAPANSDVDLTKLDDIVLRIHHQARPIPSAPAPVSFDCLARVGAGE